VTNYTLHNFSTIRLILTNCILIDAIQQAYLNRNIKTLTILFLGSSRNFQTTFTSNMHFSTDGRRTIQIKIPFSPPSLTLRQLFQLYNFHRKVATSSLLYSSYKLRKTANIIGKELLSSKPVLFTRRSYNRAGLTKRQKSFQGLAMYGHEVLMSLRTRAKFFGTHFSHSHVSDISLWQMKVYSMKERRQHC
jgi:hypothetical protein